MGSFRKGSRRLQIFKNLKVNTKLNSFCISNKTHDDEERPIYRETNEKKNPEEEEGIRKPQFRMSKKKTMET